jgi:Iap family predicted aminopeptidase
MPPIRPEGMSPGPLPDNQGRDNYAFSREIEHIAENGEEPNQFDNVFYQLETSAKMAVRELDGMTHSMSAILMLLKDPRVNLYGTDKKSAEARALLKRFELGGDMLTKMLDMKSALNEIEWFLRGQVPHEVYVNEISHQALAFQKSITDSNEETRRMD